MVANYDLCMWLAHKGLKKFDPMNTGGTIARDGFTVSLVNAVHSSGDFADGATLSLGSACGIIVKAPGQPTVWHMGDTDIFSDMALIAEIHKPEIVIMPIGDRFTMGPETASLAVKRYFPGLAIIPSHYASFGLLEQTAARFVTLVGEEASVHVLENGVPAEF